MKSDAKLLGYIKTLVGKSGYTGTDVVGDKLTITKGTTKGDKFANYWPKIDKTNEYPNIFSLIGDGNSIIVTVIVDVFDDIDSVTDIDSINVQEVTEIVPSQDYTLAFYVENCSSNTSIVLETAPSDWGTPLLIDSTNASSYSIIKNTTATGAKVGKAATSNGSGTIKNIFNFEVSGASGEFNGTVFMGAINFKAGSTLASSYAIKGDVTSSVTLADTSPMTTSTLSANVQSGTSNVIQLATASLGGNAGTITGSTVTFPTSAMPSAGTASQSLTATAASYGTITGITATAGVTVTGSAPNWTVNYGTLAAGASTTLTFNITAQDGTTTGTATATITMGNYDVHELTNLTMSAGTSSGDAALAPGSALSISGITYSSGGTATLTIPDNLTEIKFVPTYDTSKNQTCKLNGSGSSINSGVETSVNVNSITSFTIVMTSQSGNSTTYTFNLAKKSTSTDVSSVVINGNKTFALNGTEWSPATSSDYLPFTASTFDFVITSATGQTIKYNSSPYTSGTSTTVAYSGTADKVIQFFVTSEYANYNSSASAGKDVEYTIRVKKAAANTDVSGAISVQNNTNTAISLSTTTLTSAVSTITSSTDAPMNSSSIKITPTATASTTTISYSTDGVNYTNLSSTNFSIPFTTSAGSETLTVYLKYTPESGSSDEKVYTLQVTRSGGNQNYSISNLQVISGGTTYSVANNNMTNTGDAYTVNNIPYAATDFQINFVKGYSAQTYSINVDNPAQSATGLTTVPTALYPYETTTAATTSVVTLVIYAEDVTKNNSASPITITLNRKAASTDNTLKDPSNSANFTVTKNGGLGTGTIAGTYTSATATWQSNDTIPYSDATGVVIKAERTDSLATYTATCNGNTYTFNSSNEITIPFASGTGSQTLDVKITVTSESGATKDYHVKVDRAAVRTNDAFTYVVKGATDASILSPSSTTTSLETYEVIQTDNPNGMEVTITPSDTTAGNVKIFWSTSATGLGTDITSTKKVIVPIGSTYYIKVQSEQYFGTTTTGNLMGFKCQAADTRSQNSAINNIAFDSTNDVPYMTGTGTTWVKANTYQASPTNEFQITVPYSVTQLTPTVVLDDAANARWTVVSSASQIATLTAGANLSSTSTTITLNQGVNTFFIVNVAENPASKTAYKYVVTRSAGQTGQSLTALKASGNDVIGGSGLFTATDTNVYIQTTSGGISLSDFAVSAGASFEISYPGMTASNDLNTPYNITSLTNHADNVATIKVLSEKNRIDGNTSSATVYNVHIVRAQKTINVDNLQIFDTTAMGKELQDVNGSTFASMFIPGQVTQPQFKFKNSESATIAAYLTFNADSDYAYVTAKAFRDNGRYAAYTGQSITGTGTSTTVTITYQSEFARLSGMTASDTWYDSTQFGKYTLDIVRNAASTENRLENIVVYIGGVDRTSDMTPAESLTARTYSFANLPTTLDGATVQIYANRKADQTFGYVGSKITAGNGSTMTQNDDLNVSFVLNLSSTYTHNVTVVAENAATAAAQYSFKFSTTAVTVSSDASITNIKAEPVKSSDNSKASNVITGFNATTLTYGTYNVVNAYDEVEFLINCASGANTTVTNTSIGGNPSQTLTNGQSGILSLIVGTNVFKIKAIAQDGTTPSSEYTVTIERAALSTEKKLTLFEVKDDSGNMVDVLSADKASVDSSKANFYYAASTTTTDFKVDSTATVAIDGVATTMPSGIVNKTLNKGQNTLTITVTAEDGSTASYVVNLWRHEDPTFTLEAYDQTNDAAHATNLITSNTSTIDLGNVPNSFDVLNLNVIFPTTTNQTLLGITGDLTTTSGNKSLNVGLNEFTITVKSNVGTDPNAPKSEIKVKITRAGLSSDCDLLTYTKEDGNSLTIVAGVYDYYYRLDRSYTGNWNQVENTSFTHNGASVTLSTDTVIPTGSLKKFTIKVNSETAGVYHEYNFYIAKANDDPTITDIALNKSATDSTQVDLTSNSQAYNFVTGTTSYTGLEVPGSVNNLYLKVTTADNYAKSYLNGSTVQYTDSLQTINATGTVTQFKIKALSEWGALLKAAGQTVPASSETLEYVIEIDRAPLNGDSRLKEFRVKVGGVDLLPTSNPTWSFNEPTDPLQGNYTYSIADIGLTASSVTIEGVANASTSTVYNTGVKTLQAFAEAGGTVSGYNFSFTVTVRAEDGTESTYEIQLARGPMDRDTINSMALITLVDSLGNSYVDTTTFDPVELNYGTPTSTKVTEITVPFEAQSITLTPKSEPAFAGTFVGDTGQITIGDGMRGGSRTYSVKAVAANGNPGDTYIFVVNFERGDNNSGLTDLKIDGVTPPGFTPDPTGTLGNQTINISVPFEQDTIDFTSLPGSNKSSINSTGNSTKPLSVGINSFPITVTAQDGTTTVYTVNVTRETENPYLKDLTVSGEALVDVNETPVDFDKDVLEYNVVLPYTQTSATIQTVARNLTDDVTLSDGLELSQNGANTSFIIDNIAVGTKTYNATVTSADGKNITYKINVTRRDQASANARIASGAVKALNNKQNEVTGTGLETLAGDLISAFNSEFTNAKHEYNYTVPNRVTDLEFTINPESNGATNGATVRVIGAKNLQVGKNEVVIAITAADGKTTQNFYVNVEREEMNYEVNLATLTDDQKAIGMKSKTDKMMKYTVTPETTTADYAHTLKVDLGSENITALTEDDIKSLISTNASDNLEVKVLSDLKDKDLSEVIISVSDGSETQLVKLDLQTTKSGFNFDNWWIWIAVAITATILIGILIVANRDKFGKISKKRKEA